ncbi:MAG: hybrid sensor histidine kinase/response regulator [Verrucomicrobiota bacterium]
MDPNKDYKRFAVLYVDDEEKSLKYFARAFGEHFQILTATNAADGFKLIQEKGDHIGLLITDQRMPGEKGIWLLEQSRRLRPEIIRILATAFSDMDTAIDAVNTGAIYKYVTKPWDPAQMEQILKRSLDFFLVTRERDQLLREKMSVLHNMMIADRIVSLGLLAAGLSHHIRNSLVAVKTFLDLAPAKLAEEKIEMHNLRNPDFWNSYHRNVQSQIEKINNLLRDLWSASEPGDYEFSDTVQIHEVVAASLDKLAAGFAKKGLAVKNEISADLPELRANRAKILRLFELLFKDELASLPDGSRISLSAKSVGGSMGPALEIQVTDNGPGLPQEALRVVFDPFVVRTDSPMEYGIHLMACYFIVHHHGGRIEARNETGGGTTFTIRLPLNPAATSPLASDSEFFRKAMLNDGIWKQLVSQ